MSDKFTVEKPLIIMFKLEDDSIMCHLYPDSDHTYQHYGLLIADLIRHSANHFECDEQDILTWVLKEINKPTTSISEVS
jgi:hypothetical protein